MLWLWHRHLYRHIVMSVATLKALLAHFCEHFVVCLGWLMLNTLTMHKVCLVVIDWKSLSCLTVSEALLPRVTGILIEIVDNLSIFGFSSAILDISCLVLLITSSRRRLRSRLTLWVIKLGRNERLLRIATTFAFFFLNSLLTTSTSHIDWWVSRCICKCCRRRPWVSERFLVGASSSICSWLLLTNLLRGKLNRWLMILGSLFSWIASRLWFLWTFLFQLDIFSIDWCCVSVDSAGVSNVQVQWILILCWALNVLEKWLVFKVAFDFAEIFLINSSSLQMLPLSAAYTWLVGRALHVMTAWACSCACLNSRSLLVSVGSSGCGFGTKWFLRSCFTRLSTLSRTLHSNLPSRWLIWHIKQDLRVSFWQRLVAYQLVCMDSTAVDLLHRLSAIDSCFLCFLKKLWCCRLNMRCSMVLRVVQHSIVLHCCASILQHFFTVVHKTFYLAELWCQILIQIGFKLDFWNESLEKRLFVNSRITQYFWNDHVVHLTLSFFICPIVAAEKLVGKRVISWVKLKVRWLNVLADVALTGHLACMTLWRFNSLHELPFKAFNALVVDEWDSVVKHGALLKIHFVLELLRCCLSASW